MVVGRLLSYWEGNFSGAMLNFFGGGNIKKSTKHTPPPEVSTGVAWYFVGGFFERVLIWFWGSCFTKTFFSVDMTTLKNLTLWVKNRKIAPFNSHVRKKSEAFQHIYKVDKAKWSETWLITCGCEGYMLVTSLVSWAITILNPLSKLVENLSP